MRPYISIKLLADPMSGSVDLDAPPTSGAVWSTYTLWFGWWYFQQSFAGVPTQGAGGERPMRRMGDEFTWGGRSFNVLVVDYDLMHTGTHSHGAHADSRYEDGILALSTVQDQTGAASWWTVTNNHRRGPIDMNAGFQDGSVNRYLRVTWDEGLNADRVARLPEYPLTQGYDGGATRWVHAPVR